MNATAQITPWADKTSHAYAHGFEQGFKGLAFRNPCAGNPAATDNHYFGFLAGETAKAEGFLAREEYEANVAADDEPGKTVRASEVHTYGPGSTCSHGIRWPWACNDCDA